MGSREPAALPKKFSRMDKADIPCGLFPPLTPFTASSQPFTRHTGHNI